MAGELMAQYVVVMKGEGAFMFKSKENAEGFIDDMSRKRPGALFAMIGVGDDDMEARAE